MTGYANLLGEGRGGGGGNKVHYEHMKMVNSRDYNGNGYELWQNDFWDHVGGQAYSNDWLMVALNTIGQW